MALQDPIVAYNAADPYEATVLCQALVDAGIDAHIIDDEAQAGVWLGGLVPEPNKTQVWISTDDAARAKPLLEAHERRVAELIDAEHAEHTVNEPLIRVMCDKCGKESQFSETLRGSVQVCENCGGYLDVGEPVEDPNAWTAEADV